jgi:putative copper resistance protein D
MLIAFVAQFSFYLTALLLIGLAVGSALGIQQPIPGWFLAALSLFVALTYGLRLLAANVLLADNLQTIFNTTTFHWIWIAHRTQAFIFLSGCLLAAVAAAFHVRAGLMAAALVLSIGFGFAGHTQSLDSPGIFPGLVALHVLIAGFWFAAPAMLWPRTDGHLSELLKRVERFSRIALFAVPILFAAGIALAWRLADGADGLAATGYGNLILAKLAVAGAALGLGAINKTWVTARLKSDDGAARRTLRITLSIDQLLFLSALGFIAWATTIQGPEHL